MALEFAVNDAAGNNRVWSDFGAACAFALSVACAHGDPVNIDVLAYDEADAQAWAGDDGVESYREDPEASVFERIVIKAESQGRVA